MEKIALVFPIIGNFLCGGLEAARGQDDLVFIHHSCGQNWLDAGLNAALVAKDYIDERNDITYGTVVAHDAGRPESLGETAGEATDMRHWVYWFNDYVNRVRTFGCADGTNRIIMFKSCYPASNVSGEGTEPGDPFGDQTLANYRAVYRHPTGGVYTNEGFTYRALEDVFAANPDILFIPVTAPPRHYTGSSDEEAQRARQFNTWLAHDWATNYAARHPGLSNVAVYNWFDLLAYPNEHAEHPNRLREEFGGATDDSHPNDTANATSIYFFATAPANFIDAAWEAFGGGEPPTPPFAPVTDMTATATTAAVYLSWVNPTNAGWAQTVVQRRTDSFPGAPGEGSRVYAGLGAAFVDGGVTGGVTYYYTAFARNTQTNWSAAVASAQASVLVPTPPVTGAVTVVLQKGGGDVPAFTNCQDSFLANFQNPYQNVGAMEEIRLFLADTDMYRIVIRFGLEAIPAGSQVTAATLELFQYQWGGDEPPHTVSAHRMTRGWVEGTGVSQFQSDHLGVSWEESANGVPWTTPGGDYDATAVDATTLTTGTNVWHAWDLAPLVQAWVNGTHENHGLILISADANYSEHYFRSANHGTIGTRPRLTVTYRAPSDPEIAFQDGAGGEAGTLALSSLQAGTTYDVQGSSNLLYDAWELLDTFTATGATYRWSDPGTTGVDQRAYRLLQQ